MRRVGLAMMTASIGAMAFGHGLNGATGTLDDLSSASCVSLNHQNIKTNQTN